MGEVMDNSIALLLEGYQFVQNRCLKYHSDVFQTCLMGQKVICMSGAEAASIFYDNKKFKRKGVAPKRIQKTLFGKNGVQALDGGKHRDRKLMFMSIMTPENMNILTKLTKAHWEIVSNTWKAGDKIVLFDEAQVIMCRTACHWTGVPLEKAQEKFRAKDLGMMVDGFGALGLRYYEGKCARTRTEAWIRDMIEQVRTHKLSPNEETALYKIAWHRDQEEKLLSTQIAAVELINIIRPIVAIATYITFGALAMHQYPACRNKLRSDDKEYMEMFVQEVRRFYPFAPFVGARVRKDFMWRQCHFKKGMLVIFDIYGTNHDSKIWRHPDEFKPERFRNWKENPFAFVPQGGGDTSKGHRCPGEGVTIAIMKTSFEYLLNNVSYKVPKQNLKFCLRRIPTLPKSRFIIKKEKLIR